jgi:hypothetical protein
VDFQRVALRVDFHDLLRRGLLRLALLVVVPAMAAWLTTQASAASNRAPQTQRRVV